MQRVQHNLIAIVVVEFVGRFHFREANRLFHPVSAKFASRGGMHMVVPIELNFNYFC